MRRDLRLKLERFGILTVARALRERVDPKRRPIATRERAELRAVLDRIGDSVVRHAERYPVRGRALVVGLGTVAEAVMQSAVLLGARAAGYETTVLLHSRSARLERAYRAFGVACFAYWEDCLDDGVHPQTSVLMERVGTIGDILSLSAKGAYVGRYAVSTEMRRTRRGDPVLDDATRPHVAAALSAALNAADAAEAILDRVAPDAIFFIDHGYTPVGQLFDLQIGRGGACFTSNAAHRNGALILKRYGTDNRDQHPSSLSARTWRRLLDLDWPPAAWDRVQSEVRSCYESGEWFSEVGTQFGTSAIDPSAVAARLGLDPKKKTAVVFPHIFWDATFFWGTDLFRNYEDWFKEALRAACRNDRLNWVVKVHPGNTVKAVRDGYRGESSEAAAIRAAVGSLPPHVKLLPEESDVSTYSVLQFLDYCLTVRGTVGIEAAALGKRVITAGTGRYDRLGFTIDPETPGEYLDLLSRLDSVPPPSRDAVERARRYAYGVFVARPLRLQSVDFRYRKDERASLEARVCWSASQDPFALADIRAVAEWIESGEEDFIASGALELPVAVPPQARAVAGESADEALRRAFPGAASVDR